MFISIKIVLCKNIKLAKLYSFYYFSFVWNQVVILWINPLQAGLVKSIPYLVETKLKENGALFEHADKAWGPHVAVDGNLITGQNPASAGATGRAILSLLQK